MARVMKAVMGIIVISVFMVGVILIALWGSGVLIDLMLRGAGL